MARRTHNQEMRKRAYMKSPLMARACSKCSLEWKALSKNDIKMKLSWRERRLPPPFYL